MLCHKFKSHARLEQWRRQVSEFGGGGAFEGQHAFWGGKIEFHEISPPPRCQNF